MKLTNLSYELDEGEVSKFEEITGLSIPKEFRKFLLKNNVCFPQPNGFFIKHVNEIETDDKANDSLSCILGFAEKEDEENTLAWALKTYKNRMPDWSLPIAFDYAGNVICLGVFGEKLGRVFFWGHESEGEDNLLCLADSFNSFLDSLSD